MVKRIDRAALASTSASNCFQMVGVDPPESRLLMVSAIFGGARGEFVAIAAQFQFAIVGTMVR